ncbi:hypothetical protein DOY81_004916 [Sarcophaga bullata]|nr:hypothetical protein DOY81_004916 [Sarcophaga bullata]
MDSKLDMMDDYSNASLEGDMSIPGGGKSNSLIGAPDFNTLDEPIKETVLRDVRAVGIKFYHVLYPKEKSTLLKDWDLWGPLVLCTFMATILQGSANSDYDGGPEFAQVFVIVWIGAAIVTINSKLLGGNMYVKCLNTSAFVSNRQLCLQIIFPVASQSKLLFFLRLLTTAIGFSWATYASFIFLGNSQPPNRKPLAVYPIFLFFFIISWLVISNN